MSFAMDESRLLNFEAVETMDALWVVGDEADIAVMAEAGYPQTIAFHGSVDRLLKQHAEELGAVKQFHLALPSTPAGRRLSEQLARRFGRHRCWLVEWPGGTADRASVVHALAGTHAVVKALEEAAPYPIEGIHQISAAALHVLRHERPPVTMTTGCAATDRLVRLPTEGRLIVVTGYPGSGKTNWVRHVMIHTANAENRKWLVFSPEMSPWEYFMAECASVFHRKPFWPGRSKGRATLSDAEIGTAARWLRDRVIMQVCDSRSATPTLDWLIEGACDAVLRHGVTDWCIDPWNEIGHARGDMTETDYIGRSLQRLKAFGQDCGVNVWLVAHPAKPPPLRGDEQRKPPTPYDISGSAKWFDKADLGFTVHSDIAGEADVILWKSKFGYGQRGDKAKLLFDDVTGVYSDPTEDGLPL
jgi:twinkle protein